MSNPDPNPPQLLSKGEIAARLKEIGAYMRLLGEDQFRARAYENAGDALDVLGPEFEVLAAGERLTEVPGIGPSIAGVIGELRRTGSTARLEELRAELPPSLLELSQVPGMSIARIRTLHQVLGIAGLDDLAQAAAAGKLRGVKGFGAKTEQKILEGIDRYRNRPARMRLIETRALALPLLQRLRAVPGVLRAEVAGSLRRWKETVGTLRVVVAAAQPQQTLAALLPVAGFARVEQDGQDGVAAVPGQAQLTLRLPSGLSMVLVVATPSRFGVALLQHTGSRAHVEKLAARAAAGGKQLATLEAEDEAAVYATLGLPLIPPELREDAGEFEAAAAGDDFADLITAADIQGMTHCHTTYSDGRATVLQMAQAGAGMGMRYMTITDHSPTASYAGGVTVERLPEQWAEIAEAQSQAGVRLLRGTESDILADGRLDYPDAAAGPAGGDHRQYPQPDGDGRGSDDHPAGEHDAPAGVQDLGARAGAADLAAGSHRLSGRGRPGRGGGIPGGDRDQRRPLPPGPAARVGAPGAPAGAVVRHLHGRALDVGSAEPGVRHRHGPPGRGPAARGPERAARRPVRRRRRPPTGGVATRPSPAAQTRRPLPHAGETAASEGRRFPAAAG